MKASIVLVTHNHLPYIKGCVRRLAAHTSPSSHELIVIDNSSDAETVRFIRGLESTLATHVVFNDENRGYAAACNQGIHLSSAPLIVFLHTDCFVTPQWLEKLTGHRSDKWGDTFHIGAVMPVTNYANEEFVIYDLELRRRFMDYKLPNKSQPTEEEVEMVLRHTYPYGLERFSTSVKWRTPLVYSADISSFCAMFGREVFDECGLFDEKFPLRGYEDKDLYMRMKRHGFEVWIAQDCFVHHFGNITSDGDFCFPDVMEVNKQMFDSVWGQPEIVGRVERR